MPVSLDVSAIRAEAAQFNAQLQNRTGRDAHLYSASTATLMEEIPTGFRGRRQRFLRDVTTLTQDLLGGISRQDEVTPYSHHPFRGTLRVKDALEAEGASDAVKEKNMTSILVHDNREVVREKGIMNTRKFRRKVIGTLFWRYPLRTIRVLYDAATYDKNDRHGQKRPNHTHRLTRKNGWGTRSYDLADSGGGDISQAYRVIASGDASATDRALARVGRSLVKNEAVLDHVRRHAPLHAVHHIEVISEAARQLLERFGKVPATHVPQPQR